MKNNTPLSRFASSPLHHITTARQNRLTRSLPLALLCALCAMTTLPGRTAMAASRHHHGLPLTTPVELKPQPGTELDKQARALNTDLLEDASRHHDQPIILTGTARLSSHQAKSETILFVQLQSYRLCGSAGCSTSIYRKNATGWDTLLDGVNGNIRLSRHHHNGLADLIIDGNDRWIFDGQHYQDTLASP